MRGEYLWPDRTKGSTPELPPRARRIPSRGQGKENRNGTTSACAENTIVTTQPAVYFRNYLRVRGEYGRLDFATSRMMELPPRARRIPLGPSFATSLAGTTSACAENTPGACQTTFSQRNYLRVRGEYLAGATAVMTVLELPPRARRIPKPSRTLPKTSGTTSACAENTYHPARCTPRSGNYLRVRGEYWSAP